MERARSHSAGRLGSVQELLIQMLWFLVVAVVVYGQAVRSVGVGLVKEDGLGQTGRGRNGVRDFLQQGRSPKAAAGDGVGGPDGSHSGWNAFHWLCLGLDVVKETIQVQFLFQVVGLDGSPGFGEAGGVSLGNLSLKESQGHHGQLLEGRVSSAKFTTDSLGGLLHGIVGNTADGALGARACAVFVAANNSGCAAHGCGGVVSFSQTLGSLLLCRLVANVVPWRGIAELGVCECQEAAGRGHLTPHLDDFSDHLSLFHAGGTVVSVAVLFDKGAELNVA